jgi:hypothetical protein
MEDNMMRTISASLILIIFSVSSIFAQLEVPQPSPASSAYQKIGITDVTITYSSPSVNDREIWGGLVPYDEIWRTGANKATSIEFSTDVKVEGNELKAGKYALFTIPSKGEWTVIFSGNPEQSGTYNYKEEEDVLRIMVKPEENHHHENMIFTFMFENKISSDVILAWDDLKVPFNVESHLSDPESKNVRPSPLSFVEQRVGLTDIKMTFSSPGVKGRTVWGDLVAYDKIWRAGANEATTIEFNHAIKLNGNEVPVGKYSVFTIPSEGDWTIILNKTADQWGNYDYKQDDDQLRFTTAAKKSSHSHERMKFVFKDVKFNTATLVLAWGDLAVPMSIETDVNSLVHANILEAIKADPDKWDLYAESAQFAVNFNVFEDEAMEWIDKSISLEEHYWNYFIKAQLLVNKGDKDNAKEALDKSKELAMKDPDEYEDMKNSYDELEAKL